MPRPPLAQLVLTSAVRLVVQSGSTVSVIVINGLFGQASVALYSVALAAIYLIVVVFRNGLPVLLLRGFVNRKESDNLSLYRGFQATLIRSPAQYAKAAALIVVATIYLYLSLGPAAVLLFALMSPILLVQPVLDVRASYHKAIGEPVRASILEAGCLHYAITGLVLVTVWMGARDLSTVFAFGFLFFAIAGGVLSIKLLRLTRDVPRITDAGAQRAILVNSVLTFVSRNGFPLFFAAFMAAEDLGQFRVEERLFFMLMFLYFLFETVALKRLLGHLRDDDDAPRLHIYTNMACAIFAGGLLAAAAMLFALSLQPVAAGIGYDWYGNWTFLMAFSIPFYALTLFNSLILNLVGEHVAVIRSVATGAVAFLLGTYVVYAGLGIDGVRLAYFGGGATSAALSTFAVMRARRKTA